MQHFLWPVLFIFIEFHITIYLCLPVEMLQAMSPSYLLSFSQQLYATADKLFVIFCKLFSRITYFLTGLSWYLIMQIGFVLILYNVYTVYSTCNFVYYQITISEIKEYVKVIFI